MKIYLYQILLVILLLNGFAASHAEIITDGTIGATKDIIGPNFIIGQELGSQVGNNLFHSFKTFSIKTENGISESATFTGSNDIKNVISRVTGGEISTINGLLKSEVANADFYFLNPAGVIFGANAKVDVPAAFHISTADELILEDKSIFSASNPGKSNLGMAQPEAFGFLQPQTTNLIVDGSYLEFKPGSTVTLTSNNIELNNTIINSEAGIIKLIANGNNQNPVLINGSLNKELTGTIIANSSLVNVSGNGAGQLDMAADTVILNEAGLFNSNTGSIDAHASSEIQAGKLQLHNGSQIANGTFAQGNGAIINVNANELLISGSPGKLTGIGSNALFGSSGDANDVTIKVAGLLELNDGAEIFGSTFASGNAGNLNISAQQIKMKGITGQLSQIASNTFASGNAGNIDIKSNGLLEISQFAEISNSTASSGNAGVLSIKANKLLIDSQGSGYNTGIASSATTDSTGLVGSINLTADTIQLSENSNILAAHLGNISNSQLLAFTPSQLSINANHLNIQTGASISTSTAGNVPASDINMTIQNQLNMTDTSLISSSAENGDAGDINIKVNNSITVNDSLISSETFGSGNSGNIVITANKLVELQNSAISSSTYAQGDAGIISITTEELQLKNASAILSTAGVEASGRVGDINIEANNILLENSGIFALHLGNISSEIIDTVSKGKIVILADNLTMKNESNISASTNGNVNASDIALLINENLLIADSSGISSNGNIGNAGNIHIIVAKQLLLENGSRIISDALGTGNGGNIHIIVAKELLIENDSHISSDTIDTGDGGNIHIIAAKELLIENDSYISSDTLGTGNGGNITLMVDEILTLDNASEISSNSYAQGNAGTVNIKAKELTLNFNSGIFSLGFEDARGLVGDININSNTIQLSNDSYISIDHFGNSIDNGINNFTQGRLFISANSLTLQDKSAVSASADGNFPASSIELNINSRLQLKDSLIASAANTNHGGDINIRGKAGIILNNSLITTSTKGGNGGDITINSDAMVMDTGFIQANTTAGAKGGNIAINVPFLLTRHAVLPEVGGTQEQKFIADSNRNIIQAAAPEGNPGSLELSSPEVDINAALVILSSQFMDIINITEDSCLAANKKQTSTLVAAGRGGVPSKSQDPSIISFGGKRLERLLNNKTGVTANKNMAKQYKQSKNNRLKCLTIGQNY